MQQRFRKSVSPRYLQRRKYTRTLKNGVPELARTLELGKDAVHGPVVGVAEVVVETVLFPASTKKRGHVAGIQGPVTSARRPARSHVADSPRYLPGVFESLFRRKWLNLGQMGSYVDDSWILKNTSDPQCARGA